MLKPKFRISEEIMGSGKSKYYPQERKYFIWWTFEHDSALASEKLVWFRTKKEAEMYLVKKYKERMGDKVMQTKTHEFDAVFHTLKKE